jgi:hypothetical protein
MLVGDRILVAIPLHGGGYEYQVIIVEEFGFGVDGEYWGWGWDDVESYILLDGPREDATW